MNKGFLLIDALFVVIVSSFSVLVVSQMVNVKLSFNTLKNEWYEEIENRRVMNIWKIEPIVKEQDSSDNQPLS